MNNQINKEQRQRIVLNEIHDSFSNIDRIQYRDPENIQREEIKLQHVESRIKSMLKTMKYKKQIEEGKQLIDVNQQLETFPVTRKNQTEPIIVWT